MDKVKEIIAKVFEINSEKIMPEMTPDDIERWDSLGQLMLISDLEKEFNIVFDMNEIFEIVNIGDIYKILKRKKVI